ncbi:MAG: ABC transporter permease [Prolixibacteraceae bacterium]|nr:ABC transporter permease [Prolixibacteraceae bacterium]
MKNLYAALWVEILKVRKSKVFWISVIFFCFIPMALALMIFVQKYPEIAAKLGMIGEKAELMKLGEPVWSNFFNLINMFLSAVGLIGFGFITSWIFGQEYSDKTLKDVLALPVSRGYIVTAKLITALIWSVILSAVFFILSLLMGKIVGISDWSAEIFRESLTIFIIIMLLTIMLCTPIAFLSSWSRGILFPIGFIILTMILSNFTGLVGLSPYFPWSIPGLFSMPVSSGGNGHLTTSLIILFSTSAAGYLATILWWKYADHK